MGLLRLTGVTSVTQELLASSDEGTATSYMIARARGSDANPQMLVTQRNAADVADVVRGDTSVAASISYLVVKRSDGTAYTIRLNGRTEVLTVDAGGNGGDWFGDTTLRDNVTIGALKHTSEVNFLQGYVGLLLVFEGDPGMGARMKQLERMIRQRGIRALR